MSQRCLWCGGDASEPDHLQRCDGRQGQVEAAHADMDELVLRARNSDPDTSHAAMDAYDRERLAAASSVAAWLHRRLGPMADFEFKRAFDQTWTEPCDESLHRQARRTARDRGQIRDSGARKVNPATNRHQVVWEACAEEPALVEKCHACGHVLRRRTADSRRSA